MSDIKKIDLWSIPKEENTHGKESYCPNCGNRQIEDKCDAPVCIICGSVTVDVVEHEKLKDKSG